MSIKGFFDKFIPKHFAGKGLLNFLEFLAKCSRVGSKKAEENRQYNMSIWPDIEESVKQGSFIENQRKLTDLRYGKQVKLYDKMFMKGIALNASQNTCGIIALYNALNALGLEPDFTKLLYDFDRRGVVLKGYFGSSFKQIKRYIESKDLICESFVGKMITEDNIDYLEGEYTAFIFIVYNNSESLMAMMHTMCISKMENGYVIHNGSSADKIYPRLKDAVYGYNKKDDRHSKAIGIIGIKR